jgi:hypothetical protein
MLIHTQTVLTVSHTYVLSDIRSSAVFPRRRPERIANVRGVLCDRRLVFATMSAGEWRCASLFTHTLCARPAHATHTIRCTLRSSDNNGEPGTLCDDCSDGTGCNDG